MVTENHFLAYLYRLKYIKRWSLMRNVTEESVAEHSFHVALLAHLLGTIGNVIYGKSIPVDRLVTMALFHDATEVFTGDIPTPVKHQNPDILANFRMIEAQAAERLVRMVPDPLQEVYRPLLSGKLEPARQKGDGSDGRDADGEEAVSGQPSPSNSWQVLLKAADLLDALLKCTVEVSAGNREFVSAKKQIGQTLLSLDLPEVGYVLTHLMPSMEKTLDELTLADDDGLQPQD